MNPVIREFKVKDGDETLEGVFFFDADIFDEQMVEDIIRTYGYRMDNMVFRKDAPCFFLPKAQADMLRHSWLKQKVDDAVSEALNCKKKK